MVCMSLILSVGFQGLNRVWTDPTATYLNNKKNPKQQQQQQNKTNKKKTQTKTKIKPKQTKK